MSKNIHVVIIIGFFFLKYTHCHLETAQAVHFDDIVTDPTDEPQTTSTQKPLQICPGYIKIHPCFCVENGGIGDIECSRVHSEEQMTEIFQKEFDMNEYGQLTIMNNVNITVLTEGMFSNKTFRRVVINHGILDFVEAGTFLLSAPMLEHLAISLQELAEFPFEEIPQYERLFTLILSFNNFEGFPNLSSESLKLIDLSWNAISSIPKEGFSNVPNLESFLCYGCRLKEILPGTFIGFPNLGFINLGDNGLSNLQENTFDLSGEGASILVSKNNISEISVGAITATAKSLGTIDLSNNAISTVDFDIWYSLVEKINGKFEFYENPLSCECDIAWIVITPDFLADLNGRETCQDGTLVQDLDPQLYRDMCL